MVANPVYYIAIPLLTAFLLPLLTKIHKELVRVVPGLVLLFLSYMSVVLMSQITPENPNITVLAGWEAPWGINLVFGAFNGFLVTMVTILGFLIWLYSYRFKKVEFDSAQKYFILFLMLITGVIGIMLTGDIFNLFVFLEITAISSYALTAFYRGRDGAEAAFKFLLIGGFASTFILLAIVLLYAQVGTLNMAEIAIKMVDVDPKIKIIIFILFFVGFGIEAEMFPLNGWAPDAYSQAPGPVAASFAGILAKGGMYALIRVVYTLFDLPGAFDLLLVMGVITLVIAEVTALRQERLRRMLAYSSIGQMGLIMVAFSIGTQDAVFSGIFLMFNHAIIKTLLFLTAGYLVFYSTQKRISDLDGFAKKMPLVALLFGVGAFSIVGLPPFAGFWSKLHLLMAAADNQMELIIALILIISVIEIIYYFKVVSRLYFRAPKSDMKVRKPSINGSIVMVILGIVILLIGVYPDIITTYMWDAAKELSDKAGYIHSILPNSNVIVNSIK